MFYFPLFVLLQNVAKMSNVRPYIFLVLTKRATQLALNNWSLNLKWISAFNKTENYSIFKAELSFQGFNICLRQPEAASASLN